MEDLETLTPFKFFKAEGTKTRVLNLRLPEIPETAKLHRTNQYSKICPPHTHNSLPSFFVVAGSRELNLGPQALCHLAPFLPLNVSIMVRPTSLGRNNSIVLIIIFYQ